MDRSGLENMCSITVQNGTIDSNHQGTLICFNNGLFYCFCNCYQGCKSDYNQGRRL